jgi:hypothetical protein
MLDKSDWYFIITIIMFFYLIYIYKRENFQSTTTGYLADIEAIRNLSNIATQLTTNNTLTMPGALNVTNKLLIGKSADGISSSISDSTYDTNSLSIVGQGTAPNRKVTLWDNVQINGNLSIPGKNVIDLGAGDTTREGNAGKIGYNIWDDSLNIVGKGKPGEARRITMYDNVQINGNTTIKGLLNLPNNTTISADGDNATQWVRLRKTDNLNEYRSFAAQDLWCGSGTLYVNKIVIGSWTLSGDGDGFRLCHGNYQDDNRFWFPSYVGRYNF